MARKKSKKPARRKTSTRKKKSVVVSTAGIVRSPKWTDEWYAKVLAVAKTVGHPICGAKNRRGTPCRRRSDASRRSGRCKLHGSRGGPIPIHGKYARFTLTAEALAEHKHFLNDPDIASLDEEIALARAMVNAGIKDRQRYADVFDDEELVKLVSSDKYPEGFDGELTDKHKKFLRKLKRGQRIARLILSATIQQRISIEQIRKLIETRERRRREGYIARDDVVFEFSLHFGAFFRGLESQLGSVLTAEIFGTICRSYVRDVGAPAETVVEATATASDAGRALVEAWAVIKAEKEKQKPKK